MTIPLTACSHFDLFAGPLRPQPRHLTGNPTRPPAVMVPRPGHSRPNRRRRLTKYGLTHSAFFLTCGALQ